jgi:hypothetical protein
VVAIRASVAACVLHQPLSHVEMPGVTGVHQSAELFLQRRQEGQSHSA